MIIWTFAFPDEATEERVILELSEHFGYAEQVLDAQEQPVPNPESRLDFAKRMEGLRLRQIVSDRIVAKATDQTRAAVTALIAQTVVS